MGAMRSVRDMRDRGPFLLTRRSLAQGGALAVAGALALGGPGISGAAQEATPATGTPPGEDAPSWADVDGLFTVAAPAAAVLAAELVDGNCETIHALDADVVLPVGSSFKLWILGAVALEIQAGRLDWDQLVTIEDRYRSVPGGDLRFALAGTQYTLRYIVERMIQKSDNTATDHAFYLVGRDNVEVAMVTMGQSDPALNEPIISTRELALLKFANTTAFLDDYYALPIDERRAILDGPIAQQHVDTIPDLNQTAPLEIDRVEWFATREDLCRSMAWLSAKATEPGMRPVAEVLALETQLAFDGETWPYAGFKGGSELGVLSGTWLLQRADGRFFVYSAGFRNPDAAIDTPAAVVAMEAGRDRLALTP